MKRLQNKIALITGAASGIGRAIAVLFAKEGATVIATDVNDVEGKKLISELGDKSIYLNLDVSQESQWKKVMEEINKKFGRIDILINNAGIMGVGEKMGPQDPENASLESWHKVHAVNLDGVFLGCKYAIQSMKKNSKGSIVNISSRSGIVGIPVTAAYASSKAAVRNHTKSVALYCAGKGYDIRCNSVHPAAILTPIWDHALGSGPEREKNMKVLTDGIPLKRMGTPEEVAYAVLYLASDEASFVTGAEFVIDGGILAGSAASPK